MSGSGAPPAHPHTHPHPTDSPAPAAATGSGSAGLGKPKLSPRQPSATQQLGASPVMKPTGSPTVKPASGGAGGMPNLVMSPAATSSHSHSQGSPTHSGKPVGGGSGGSGSSSARLMSTTSKPVLIERRDSKQHSTPPMGSTLAPPYARMERRNSTDGTALADSKASKKLWDSIEQFFKLIDIDGNGSVDINEAHASLTICLANVKNSGERLEQVVRKQVKWLFSSADENKDQVISLDEFMSCYRKLLRAGYEPEVLQMDIDKAIQSLGTSRRLSTDSESKFYHKCSRLFHLLDANRDGVVSVAEARSSLLLCFAAVQNTKAAAAATAATAKPADGKSAPTSASGGAGNQPVSPTTAATASLSPSSAAAMNDSIDRQVAWLFSVADVNGDKVISENEFLLAYKKLLAAKYEKEVLEIDLDRAIGALEPIRAAEAKKAGAPAPASPQPATATAATATAPKSSPASAAAKK